MRGEQTLARDLAASLSIEMYERAAEALELGFALNDMDGHPLSQLQRKALIQSMIHSMDGLEANLESHLTIDAQLTTKRLSFEDVLGPAPDDD